MKKFLFITHTLVFIAGLLIALAYFVFYGLPLTARYVVADPYFIKMTKNAEKESYSSVLQESYLGGLYLRHPALFLKRNEGKNLLKGLSERGYTPAMGDLFSYHVIKHQFAESFEEEKKHLMDAHQWAMLAAEFGDYRPLHTIFHVFNLYEYKEDVSEELTLLEKAAKSSLSHVFATDLSVYYELQEGNKEKAEKWLRIAEEIYQAPYEEPACRTITPQKTSYIIPKP